MDAPARFGRYRVERRIGSGSFATVWLAHDEVLDAPVAVKVLADNWAHRLDVRERFEEEARILRRADSDRVVRVHDIGELDDGRPYFVMTYADRGTLADRLAEGPVPVPLALRYGADVARGLAVLHEVGVIHRDVNPANVLLRSGRGGVGDRVLVADLGLAKAAARGSGFTLTVGTPGYMAPEQASGGGVTRRTDVYAVGALLWHLATGAAPELDAPLPPTSLPPAVEAVLRQALARRPEDRFPSATALADALDAAAIELARTPAAPRPEPGPAARTRGGSGPSGSGSSGSGPSGSAGAAAGSAADPEATDVVAPDRVASSGSAGAAAGSAGDPEATDVVAPDRVASSGSAGAAAGSAADPEATDVVAPDRVVPAAASGHPAGPGAPEAGDDRGGPARVAERRWAAGGGGAEVFRSAAEGDVTEVFRPDRDRMARPAVGSARPVVGSARPAVGSARPAVADGTMQLRLRRPRRWGRRIALLAVLVVLLGGAAVGYVLVQRSRQAVDVTAASGLHVRVPAAWGRQQQSAGWDLTPLGAAGKQGTALLVARDVAGWRDPASATPGVFVGAGRGVTADRLWAASAARTCPYTTETRRLPSGLSGTVRRHDCPGAPARVTEAVLTRAGSDLVVFVQVKEPLADDDAAAVLDSVSVGDLS